MRKTADIPKTVDQSKSDAKYVLQKLSAPRTIQYREVADGGVFFLQTFGCFCLGEMLGRKSVVGYNVGGPNPYHDRVH